ncbi:hypothetical protein [Rhodohalobacter sp. SW132]|nr:hypothetical protein [Rhodohalobacter sp. SW132]
MIFFIGFIILPYFSFGDFAYLFPRAVFLSGVAAVLYTWHDFRKRSLWALFDNLRYPKFLLLTGMFLSLQLIPIIVNLLL